MPLSPEDSQRITDLRSRMLANLAAGRQPWEGCTKEELRSALDQIRSGRSRAAAAATKSRKSKEGAGPADMSFLAKLGIE